MAIPPALNFPVSITETGKLRADSHKRVTRRNPNLHEEPNDIEQKFISVVE